MASKGMKTADMYICKRLATAQNFSSAYSAAEGPPTEWPAVNETAPGLVGKIEYTLSDSSYICKFNVMRNVTKANVVFTYEKNFTYHILLARGELTDWTTTYHKDAVF